MHVLMGEGVKCDVEREDIRPGGEEIEFREWMHRCQRRAKNGLGVGRGRMCSLYDGRLHDGIASECRSRRRRTRSLFSYMSSYRQMLVIEGMAIIDCWPI